MRLSTVEKLVKLASRILYTVIEKRTSLDRAFQEVVKGSGRKEYSKVPHSTLYKLCKCVARDYVSIAYYLKRFASRESPSMRLIIKTWIALKGEELFGDNVARKYRKRLGISHQSIEEAVTELTDRIDRFVMKYSFPKWFIEELIKHLGESECERLLEALNRDYTWIRVNTLKVDVDRVARILEERGLVIELDRELPYMIRVLHYDTPNQYLDLVKRCDIVLQDKASAIVVEELGVEPGDLVLDVAAAPGVKTSLIMQLTGNRARVIALDVSRERVSRMRKFLKCMGVDVDRVDIALADSTKLLIQREVPKALVDAPCSGSGTVPRDPATKIHLMDRAWVEDLNKIQRAMLRAALSTASTTVYAVCSVLPLEGEYVVKDYAHMLVKTRFRGSPGLLGLGDAVSRFYPHVHETHGFFIAKLRKEA